MNQTSSKSSSSWRTLAWLPVPIGLFVLLLLMAPTLLSGCNEAELATHYGSRQVEREGDTSVNGLGVLSRMFEAAGHRVNSVSRLTPRVGRSADVIVWFPDDFSPPSKTAVEWLEEWLEESADRTLIFVPHDYDAEEHYWAKVASQASPADAPVVAARQAAAKGLFDALRSPTGPQPEDWTWFRLDRSPSLVQRSVRSLSGNASWTSGVDATQLEIELYGRIQRESDDDEIVLQSGADPLVIRKQMSGIYGGRGGQIIVVANGSLLLNVPLVNREHRKLAGSLIDEVGKPKKSIVFLEAGSSPVVLDEDPPPPRMVSSLMYFDVPLIQNLLWHLSALTLIVCFALFAVLGRPREEKTTFPSDFGEHVEALGDLLSKTKNAAYARERLAQYQMLVRGDTAGRRRATRT
jgi:hypothetical protein